MSVKKLVDEAIAENKIVVFSKSYCPYCKKAKGTLNDEYKDTPAKVFELDERDDGAAIQEYLKKETGQSTVPNIYINQQHVGGNDALQALKSKGKLPAITA